MENKARQRGSTTPATKRGTPAKTATKPGKKTQSEFLCDLKFSNTLPDIPFEPKFLRYPFAPDRWQKYTMTPLEQNYQYRIHLSPGVGSDVQLIDPTTAEVRGVTLAEEDSFLLRRDESGAGGFDGRRDPKEFMPSRSKSIKENKPWLVKTQYIDNDLFRGSQSSSSKATDAKAAEIEARKKELASQTGQLSLVEQVEKSFDVNNGSKSAPRHSSKPHLRPVKVFDVLPHMLLCENDYYQVTFVDPALLPSSKDSSGKETKVEEEDEETNAKRIRHGLLQEKSGAGKGNIVEYMLPKVKENIVLEDQQSWVRDYSFTVRPSTEGERFAFIFQDDADTLTVGPDGIPRGKAQFVPLEPMALELKRTKLEDVNQGKRKRKQQHIINVSVERRDLTEDEKNVRSHKAKVVLEGAKETDTPAVTATNDTDQNIAEDEKDEESSQEKDDVWGDDDSD